LSGFSGVLELYDQKTKKSLVIASLLSSMLGLLDFISIVALYPVLLSITNSSKSNIQDIQVASISVSPVLLAIFASGTIVVRSVLNFVFRRWWFRASSEAELRLGDSMLRKYTFADYSFHLENNSSKLLSRNISSVDQLTTSGLVGFVSLVTEVSLLVGLVTALIVVNPTVGLTVGFYAVVLMALFNFASKAKISKASNDSSTATNNLFKEASQLLTGIRELTVYDVREKHLELVHVSRSLRLEAKARLSILLEYPKTLMEVVLYLTVMVAITGLIQSDSSSDLIPLVGLYIIAAMRILPSISRAINYLGQIRFGISLASEINSELSDIRIDSIGKSQKFLRQFKEIVFDEVHFQYQGSQRPSLERISFKVPFGSFVGIMGQSGSGKTTLANIVLSLLRPTSGKVKLTLVSGEVIDLSEDHGVSFVPQDVFILDTSILENIQFGREPIDAKDLKKLLQDADLHEFVSSLEKGVHTSVGERGKLLSAGQRQRVGIARALYSRPTIMILDEPTSSLDHETEANIMKTVFNLRGVVTTFCIAHRTHTLKDSDILLELENGAIKTLLYQNQK